MIAPPNKGIELVDRFGDQLAFARIFGPTALQLRTGEDSWPQRLGRADYPVGIIMGSPRLRIPITSRILPGQDDGIVSLESGKLEGMRQMIQVPRSHTTIQSHAETLRQAQSFIQSGRFSEQRPPATSKRSRGIRLGPTRVKQR